MRNEDGWLYFCPHLSEKRWELECALMERFSLFFPFVEVPFLGFRGMVSRGGVAYRVTVGADMDLYPRCMPSLFVTPSVLGSQEDREFSIDFHWDPEASFFAMVIGELVRKIETVHGTIASVE